MAHQQSIVDPLSSLDQLLRGRQSHHQSQCHRLPPDDRLFQPAAVLLTQQVRALSVAKTHLQVYFYFYFTRAVNNLKT